MATTLSNILLEKEILLESGTNELELLVFDVADYTFGINVAKVREVMPTAEITGLPRSHSSVRGVFNLRNEVIPCVSLRDHLGVGTTHENPESTMILTDLNQQQTAFLVDGVERIRRLSWENVLAVPALEALATVPVTALARCEDRLVVMLDFEKILDDVTNQYFRTDAVENPLGLLRQELRILFVEDSPTVREAIGNTLRASGYTQTLFFPNGDEAWRWMVQRFEETGRLEDVGDLVISDIEMPQVDGLHLTKRIKGHPELKELPVLLYSSIVTADNEKKGRAVGADAQVSKPELKEVVRLADELISTTQRENRAAALRKITQAARTQEEAPAEPPAAKGPTTPEPPPQQADPPAPTPEDLQSPPAPASEAPAPPLPRRELPVASPAQAEVFPTTPEPAERPTREEPTLAPEEIETRDSAARPFGGASSYPTDERPAPEGVDVWLWGTFRRELTGHVATLGDILERSQWGDRTDELFRQTARTLHTVKSAAMVIPLDQVTTCTHLTETLMEAAREDRQKWPQEALQRYLEWLDQLLSPPDADIGAALRSGHQLEQWLKGSNNAE